MKPTTLNTPEEWENSAIYRLVAFLLLEFSICTSHLTIKKTYKFHAGVYHHCLSLWYLFLFHLNCNRHAILPATLNAVCTLKKTILHPHIHETIILSKKQLKYLKIKGLFIQIIKVKSAFWANIFECGWLIWWLVRSIPPSFSSPSNSHFLTFKYLKMIVWIMSSFHFSPPLKTFTTGMSKKCACWGSLCLRESCMWGFS